VNCSLKTLAFIRSAQPIFLDVDQQSFISALTIVFDHSRALGSLMIENIPMDDTSLEVLASSNSKTLELLQMKNCPRVSAEGKTPAMLQTMRYGYLCIHISYFQDTQMYLSY
jgi:hypothetical protein